MAQFQHLGKGGQSRHLKVRRAKQVFAELEIEGIDGDGRGGIADPNTEYGGEFVFPKEHGDKKGYRHLNPHSGGHADKDTERHPPRHLLCRPPKADEPQIAVAEKTVEAVASLFHSSHLAVAFMSRPATSPFSR